MPYYKITQAQADLVGRFEYEPHKEFDPYVNEQEDGTFLVDEFMYNILKDHPSFKKFSWTVIIKITDAQIQTKPQSGGSKESDGGSK